jgi:DNA-directed RNA polymerase alpha subunit
MHTHEILFYEAERSGIIATLHAHFGGNIKMSLPMSQKALDEPIDLLCLSVRSGNALRRAGINNLNDIFEAISNGKLSHIRNLGRKSENEIKSALLAFGYEQLTASEKLLFLKKLCEAHLP